MGLGDNRLQMLHVPLLPVLVLVLPLFFAFPFVWPFVFLHPNPPLTSFVLGVRQTEHSTGKMVPISLLGFGGCHNVDCDRATSCSKIFWD